MERAETLRGAGKLAIWHFFLWMTCVGAIAAWYGPASGAIQGPWLLQLQQSAAGLSYNLIAGLALAGLVLAIGCALLRRSYFPVSAGHWLLATGGVIFLLSEASNRITDAWYHASGGTHQVEYARHVGIYAFALMAIAYLTAAWKAKDTWPWRGVLLGYAAGCLLWSITNLISTFGERRLGNQVANLSQRLQWPWQCLMFAAVATLAMIDLYRGRSRDWLHWTGIGYVAVWVISSSVLDLVHRLATQ